MGVDKSTSMSYLSFVIDDDKKLLDYFRACAESNNGIEEHKKNPELWINSYDAGFKIECDEYYFDDEDNEIEYSGSIKILGFDQERSISFTISLPLSDEVLIDILQHSMKKLGKLKTALETLK